VCSRGSAEGSAHEVGIADDKRTSGCCRQRARQPARPNCPFRPEVGSSHAAPPRKTPARLNCPSQNPVAGGGVAAGSVKWWREGAGFGRRHEDAPQRPEQPSQQRGLPPSASRSERLGMRRCSWREAGGRWCAQTVWGKAEQRLTIHCPRGCPAAQAVYDFSSSAKAFSFLSFPFPDSR